MNFQVFTVKPSKILSQVISFPLSLCHMPYKWTHTIHTFYLLTKHIISTPYYTYVGGLLPLNKYLTWTCLPLLPCEKFQKCTYAIILCLPVLPRPSRSIYYGRTRIITASQVVVVLVSHSITIQEVSHARVTLYFAFLPTTIHQGTTSYSSWNPRESTFSLNLTCYTFSQKWHKSIIMYYGVGGGRGKGGGGKGVSAKLLSFLKSLAWKSHNRNVSYLNRLLNYARVAKRTSVDMI